MSHELILLADPQAGDSRRREALVRRAATGLPASMRVDIGSTPSATVALVECRPIGGTYAIPPHPGDHPADVVAGVVALPHESPHAALKAFGGHESGGEGAGLVTRLLDRTAPAVEVTNDGVGLLPSYFVIHNGGLYLSTSMAALFALGVPLSWDHTSALEYLTLLHPLSDRTLAQGIKVLPAGSELVWTAGELRIHTQSLLDPADTPTRRDGDLIEEFRSVWPSVVADIRRRASGRIGIGLSGGLDSRSIAVELSKSREIVGFTFGSPQQAEVRVASSVARKLRIPHHVLPVAEHLQLSNARQTIELLDGAHSYAEMFDSWFIDDIRRLCDVAVSGLAGDCIWGSDRGFGPTAPDVVALQVAQRYRHYLLQALPLVDEEIASNAQDAITAEIASGLRAIRMPVARRDLSTYWNLQNRQRRWGYMLGGVVRRSGVTFEAPFLDSRFLAFGRSMSDDQRRRGRLHAAVQRRVFPETAGIPRGNDGNSPNILPTLYFSDDESLVRQSLELGIKSPVAAGRRAIKYSQVRIAAELSRRSRSPWATDRVSARRDVFQSAKWARLGGQYQVRTSDLLEEALGHVPDFLDRSAIVRRLDDCRAMRATEPLMTARVVSLCLWHKYWSELSASALS